MTKIDFDAPGAAGMTRYPCDERPVGGAHPTRRADLRAPLRRPLRAGVTALRDYYEDRRAWRRLIVTALVLFYAGGGAMFWLHAVYRGEKGPPIAPGSHWMVDSSLGFLTLTPILFLLLPLARALSDGRSRAEPFVLGGLFALLTTPGPAMHNLVAGEGTPLAQLVTSVLGFDPDVALQMPDEHSIPSEAVLQLAVGLPVYVFLAQLAWLALSWHDGTRSQAGPDAFLGEASR